MREARAVSSATPQSNRHGRNVGEEREREREKPYSNLGETRGYAGLAYVLPVAKRAASNRAGKTTLPAARIGTSSGSRTPMCRSRYGISYCVR
eukprot:355041-Chlamydomonas_euryale.AAC.12